MNIQQLVHDTNARLKTFHVETLFPSLRALNSGALEDVKNANGCAYYQFSTCLVEIMKPKQIVELGGAMGVWDLMVLHSLPEESKLYSVTLPENGLEFSFIVDNYPNLYKIVGNDLDLNIWNNVALGQTDLWFIDTFHQKEQLEKELELYKMYFKKGAIIMLDDIHINEGMDSVWNDIQNGKYGFEQSLDMTDPLHYTGFGIIEV